MFTVTEKDLFLAAPFAVYLVLNAAVNAMLPPESGKERTVYGYFYRFFHGVAMNADKVVAARFPQLQ
jgi:hypothetical protein